MRNFEPNLITDDIHLLFKHSFLENAGCQASLEGWLMDKEVEHLCERAAGLFVYAVARVKFVDKQGTSPGNQLNLLTGE